MILITTAGKIGTDAARLLIGRGQPVRIVVRNPAKASALRQDGVEVVEADLEVPGALSAALDAVTSVILVTPPVVRQELNVIASAQSAGAPHIVKVTSKASPDSPIARRRNQAEIENALTTSGLPHTLLRNNAYMQNFLLMAPGIARTSSFSTATGAGRIGHLDARDAAAVAAEIAASPDEHIGKTYWPTGPEVLTATQVATVLSDVLERTIIFHSITPAQQKQAMLAVGLPEPVAEDNARAVAMMADGDCDYLTEDVSHLIGRPAGTFARFAADFAAAFS